LRANAPFGTTTGLISCFFTWINMKHAATAIWRGTGKSGQGHITTESLILKEVPYTMKSRFEDGFGTNPEELIAAAHAACFTMKLSFVLVEAGFIPIILRTKAFTIMEHGV